MGVQSCLLLRVSLHNQQNVEIFCLNTAIYTIIKQQLSGGGVAIFVTFVPSRWFSREIGCNTANLCPSNNPKKVCMRPCDTNNLTQSQQESTTILQLKVYIVYLVQKLVGHSPWQECPIDFINLSLFVFPFVCNARSLDHQFFLFFPIKFHIIK